MAQWMRYRIVLAMLLWCGVMAAQELPGGGAEGPHSAAALYRQLRAVGLDPNRIYRVREAHIEREDLHLSFDHGVLAFTYAIDGRVTGAFFEGEGEVLLSPPDRVERASLGLFTGAAILDGTFTTAYLRFNDETPDELEPGLRPFQPAPPLPEPDAAPGADQATDVPAGKQDDEVVDPRDFIARGNSISSTLAQIAALRLLVTFVNAETLLPDGSVHWQQPANDHYLHARLGGTKFGVFDLFFDSLLSEQIAAAQRVEVSGTGYYDVWTSFPMRSARARVTGTSAGVAPPLTAQTQAAAEAVADPVRMSHYTIRAHVQPPRELGAEATLELQTSEPGSRILIFELSRFLKVKEVTADGRPLELVQNEALEGSSLARRGNDLVAVVFPAPLAPGRTVRLRFVYSGEVLSDAGGGLMYVGARGIWYPNRGLAMSNFDLEFRYPAEWTLIATGKRVAPPAEAGTSDGHPPEQVVRYASERPIPVAGFNLGRYVEADAKAGKVRVETYAARGVEDSLQRPQAVIAGQTDPFTTRRIPPIVQIVPLPPPKPAEHVEKLARTTADAIDFLAARLGPFPYSSLAMTQMPGPISQGWPGLVYLSSMSFLSPEERARMHIGNYGEVVYGRVMPAHETAHQWWGDLLLWKSYREQWLVEALSNYCVLLMLEGQDPAAFRVVMERYRHDLLQRNKNDRVISDAGPVTLGIRLNSSHFPDAYDTIAYGRGTWLFYMLHRMLLDGVQLSAEQATPATRSAGTRARKAPPEDTFFTVLRGLRQRFEGKEINTRDVQKAFEDALPESLRYDGEKSLEWFFDGWVNGTAIPALELAGVKLSRRGSAVVATGKVEQKHAPKDLVTSVPLYADVPGRKPFLLGRLFAEGAETPFRFTVPAQTRRILLDPLATVLSRP